MIYSSFVKTEEGTRAVVGGNATVHRGPSCATARGQSTSLTGWSYNPTVSISPTTPWGFSLRYAVVAEGRTGAHAWSGGAVHFVFYLDFCWWSILYIIFFVYDVVRGEGVSLVFETLLCLARE